MEQNNDAVDQNASETPVVDQQQEQAQPEQEAPIVAQEGSEEPAAATAIDLLAEEYANMSDADLAKQVEFLLQTVDQDTIGADHVPEEWAQRLKAYFFDEEGVANTVEMVRLLMADEEEVKPAEESVEDEQAAIDAEAAAAAAQLAAGDVVEEKPAIEVTIQITDLSEQVVLPTEEPAAETPAEDQTPPEGEEGSEPDAPIDEVDPVEPPPEAEGDEDVKADEEGEAEPAPEEEDPTAEVDPTSLEGIRASLVGVLPADALAAWDRDTLLTYIETKAQPTKTARGSWPIDLRRAQSMINWTGNELADWVDGIINTPKGMDEELIYDELYKRYRLPNNWTHEAVKAFVQTGEQPAVTEHGVLIEDRMRERKTASQWTHLELRSALLGQIETDLPKEELVDSLKARLGLSNEFSGQRILETLAETPTEASMDNILLKSKLDEYKDVMSKYGKNLSDVTAGKAQVMLYKAIRQVMARDSVGFTEGWNILLDFINTNYTLLFLPEIARRGYNQLGISKSAALTFEDLVSLLITTRAPGTRQREAKIYKLDQILRYVPNEEERQNVILYYADAQ
ncbi:hypothetical protein D3C85_101380 [compost metagenome]